MSATKDELKLQLDNARRYDLFALLEASASHAGLPLAYVLAIGSRETNLTNELGDGGHGHGVLQIDDRSFPVLCKRSFRAQPDLFIEQGCALLASNLRWARHHWPNYSEAYRLRIAADEYNCGPGNEVKAVADGHADERTAHADYGADVMCRKAIFEELLKP